MADESRSVRVVKVVSEANSFLVLGVVAIALGVGYLCWQGIQKTFDSPRQPAQSPRPNEVFVGTGLSSDNQEVLGNAINSSVANAVKPLVGDIDRKLNTLATTVNGLAKKPADPGLAAIKDSVEGLANKFETTIKPNLDAHARKKSKEERLRRIIESHGYQEYKRLMKWFEDAYEDRMDAADSGLLVSMANVAAGDKDHQTKEDDHATLKETRDTLHNTRMTQRGIRLASRYGLKQSDLKAIKELGLDKAEH